MAQEVNVFAAQASWPELDSSPGWKEYWLLKVALWLLHATLAYVDCNAFV